MCKFLWECSIWSAFLTEHQFTVRLILFKKNPYLLWLKKHFRAKLWLFQAFFKNCWLLIIVIEKLTADLLIFFIRRYFWFGRYTGYTPGSSEYSVKSLTEREASKLLSFPREPPSQRLHSPPSLSSNQQPLNNSGNEMEWSKYCGSLILNLQALGGPEVLTL